MKLKALLIIFKGLSVARNCPRAKSGPYSLTFTAFTKSLARTGKHIMLRNIWKNFLGRSFQKSFGIFYNQCPAFIKCLKVCLRRNQ